MLTITEANAVNTLLCYMMRIRRGGLNVPNPDQALAAAQVLARGANRTLNAGLSAEDVEKRWHVRSGGDQ